MKNNTITLTISVLLLFGMYSCSKEKVGLQSLATDTPECRDAVRAMKLVEIASNEVGRVEQYLHRRNQSMDKDTLYFIKFPTYRNLLACNMPEEFKQDSLQVRFSGEIYDSKREPGPYMGFFFQRGDFTR